MRELGADHVIDYRTTNYTSGSTKYDLILDLVAHRPPWAYQRALKKGGRFYVVGGPVKVLVGVLAWSPIARLMGKRIGVLAVRQGVDRLQPLAERVTNGEIRVLIDKTFPLTHAKAALTYLGEGHALGKVVVYATEDPRQT